MRIIKTWLPTLLVLLMISCSKEEELKIFQIEVNTTLGGEVEGVVKTVVKGESVTLTAKPSNENFQHYKFVKWNGDVVSTKNPITITPDKNLDLYAIFELETIIDDELYSQIDFNNPKSFLEIFIKDAKRHGVDLSNVDVENARIIIEYSPEREFAASSLLACSPNDVLIRFGGGYWDRRNDNIKRKKETIAIMWHEFGHDILGIGHLCAGGQIMSSHVNPSCQGEDNTGREFMTNWGLVYNSSDPYLNFQRAVKDMFENNDQYLLECRTSFTSKNSGIIYD